LLKNGIMKTDFERLRVYKLSEDLTDKIWELVVSWNQFAKDTLGKQLVRAADSIGANIAEGVGRGASGTIADLSEQPEAHCTRSNIG
jgi:hypothetical protein